MNKEQAPVKLSGLLAVKDGSCTNSHSLMTAEQEFDGHKAIKIKIKLEGKSGMLYLDPVYGHFNYFCDMPLNAGDIVEMFCPHCDVSLSTDAMCNMCNIHMFAVHLPDGGEVQSCPKVGCHNHALKIIDVDEQLSRMYVDETKFQM